MEISENKGFSPVLWGGLDADSDVDVKSWKLWFQSRDSPVPISR